GIAPDGPGNAITQSTKIRYDRLLSTYPNTKLSASGLDVGLPDNEDGNTETGHLNLGAGRVIYQDLQRINIAIDDGTFFHNQVLLDAIEYTTKHHSTLHFMGLIGGGGVHSNTKHLSALIDLAAMHNTKNLSLHLFTDGRDSPPSSALDYIIPIENHLKERNIGKIASVMGRYWSMDRDQRWDRTKKAYDALTSAKAKFATSAEEVIKASYELGITDEFIEPTLITDSNNVPLSLINDKDAIIFFNFRIDRPRQLTRAFVSPDDRIFGRQSIGMASAGALNPIGYTFKREKFLKDLFFVTMTEYSADLYQDGTHTAFPPEVVDFPLSAVISAGKMKQLKITESEKERFVTFYFNGRREEAY
ncbi:MAG TPA: 2,3-bisphosphoglycerate-independent phosphoglycerate mutase, partial [Saprospiraceae bacterium]|nr:2,3-bisphosphoglycerate-independent phosphoglycerate mutase [Saprospiraceae bacterium]